MSHPTPRGATIEFEIRYRDLDPLGHVNNAVYFTYLETARVRFWSELGFSATARDWPFVIAEAQYSYKSPLYLGERARVSVAVGEVRRSSFDFHYEVHAAGDERLIGAGRTVQVCYDFERRMAMPIPDYLRAVLLRASHAHDADGGA